LFTGRGLICTRGERTVFRALDFALRPGGALVLAGRNGAGKTSLLRLMAGLLPPASGTLEWDTAPLDPDAHRARLRYIGHADALKAALTVRENLSFWAAFDGGGDVAAALAGFGLAAQAETPARFLSAGQRRRTSLARLLLAPRALWLLDEPGASLDAAGTEVLAAAIDAHRAKGGMVALSAHGAPPVGVHDTIDIDVLSMATS
jgi:heme exporter protein A